MLVLCVLVLLQLYVLLFQSAIQICSLLEICRMSSLKESVGGVDTPTDDPFELSEEESVELTEEARDTVDENLDDEENGSKRKGKSNALSHFITVELKMQGKMVKKH
ncbi:hypothetical protein L1987_65825 [Smallanthus sonchifolius]|uniref:Uncharacterized protein n=1 Tax=Smallanthus sonchifolius TaxID=185202 RepID=A0ACB9BVH7_9ASTR|nr:hypothetical protein L1987_65825 [Smallanthus sonchifolius]